MVYVSRDLISLRQQFALSPFWFPNLCGHTSHWNTFHSCRFGLDPHTQRVGG